MKNIKKNFIKISFVLVIIITIFSSVLLPKDVSAEESWYYTTKDFSGKKIYSDEFTSKEECLISKQEIHPSWEPSEDCYSEKEMIPTPLKEKEDVVQEKTVPTDNGIMLPQTKTTPEEQVNKMLENINPTNVINKAMEADTSVGISPQPGTNIENKSTYTLLAPFLGLKCIDTSGTNPDCAKGGIGDYLNLIFNIAIALCGALAVIMIIIGGIEYMGEESVFGKTKAKSRITSALLGLVIALGSYAILNTINPELLGKGGVNLESVDLDIETQPLTYNDSITEGMTSNRCPEGIVTAQTENGSIPVCKRLEKDIKDMVSAANKDNIKLTGFGYRSTKRQEEFRRVNCGGEQNIYNEKAVCNPLTAMPGRSNHEHGLAVDFRCDGTEIISSSNKCFIWLSKYAKNYNYENLKKEPWHWSIDGR